jgi:hypothetical protein
MLDERETDHLVSCELCQELLIFFEEQSSTLNQSQPDDKAA